MGEWVRTVNADGNVEPKKTTDAMLEYLREVCIQRDTLAIELGLMKAEQAIQGKRKARTKA